MRLFHHLWYSLLSSPHSLRSADGFFNAELIFPDEFPNMPPTMKFTDDLWHPNSASCVLQRVIFAPH